MLQRFDPTNWTCPQTIVALAMAGALGGCSFTRGPSTSVTDARVTQVTDDAVVVEFTLTAENANPDPLPLRDIRYTLVLDGKTVFSGSRSPEATVRPESSQVFKVPAAFHLEPGWRATPRSYTLSGSVTYLEPGTLARILFDSDVLQPSTTFTNGGTIVLDAKP